jgi:uncharacterized membrane protein YfcA
MELELITFLIVCPLVFLAGLIDAIAGGGGLISLPAYLFAGLPPHLALGTNKISSMMGTFVATIRYYRHGFIDLRLCVPCVIAALAGSALGAQLVMFASEEALQKLLLILLPCVAIYMLKNKNLTVAPERSRRATLIIATLISLALGVYDGFFGPGMGTFLVLCFMGLAGLSPQSATGNTKVVNLASNVAALAIFAYHGSALWALGLVAGVFNLIGGYIGAGLAIKKGSNAIRWAILFVLALLFVKMAWELIG